MANYSNLTLWWPNATLEKYFTEEVAVKREKTEAIIKKVLPNIEKLLQHVNDQDKRFDKDPVQVGSYTQGLGVNVKRDYDFNIVFRSNPNVESNSLEWIEETTSYCGPNLGPGYYLVITDQGLLNPLKVREHFRTLVQNAIAEVDRDGKKNLKLLKTFHGPALQIDTKVKTDDGITHKVSIDLSVIIRAQLPFLLRMGWPVPGAQWPSTEKIQAILKKGINDVAKKDFHWQLSFAELEKLLVREIDEDDRCRKKVHRIMKSVFYTVCKDKPTISTYILKNVWFHECEEYPESVEWKSDCLGKRYRSCLQRLIDCSKAGVLLQYFDRRVNLLEGKDISSDVEKIRCFDFRRRKTSQSAKKRRSDGGYTPPPKKQSRASH